MLGRRSAPWCVPPHPIYIWMSEGVGGEGEVEERMEGRTEGKDVSREFGRSCLSPFLSRSLGGGGEKKIWMKGDVVVAAAAAVGGRRS